MGHKVPRHTLLNLERDQYIKLYDQSLRDRFLNRSRRMFSSVRKWSYLVLPILLSGTISIQTAAQSTSDMAPENEAHVDTAVQKDLLDVYKKWFKLPPKTKNPHPENK